jgi:hypothetical protein
MPLDHDQPPQQADEPHPEVLRKLQELQASPYVSYVKPLKDKVAGRMVVRTEAGHSGFVLYFDDESWVLCHLEGDELRWRVGSGVMPPADQSLMTAPLFGDASLPVGDEIPYGTEPCNIAAEIANAVGQQISTLAFGERCFNFCFPNGRELEVTLLKDRQGKQAFRVYWEQW